MRIRNLFLALVVAALGLAVVPGLGAQEKTSVVLWHAYRGAERKALEKTVEQLNA